MHQTSMAGHHRLRRPKQQQQQQQQQQQHDQERLQQVLSRLQSALNLGLRPTSQLKTGDKKWYNTDAEVQLQAARAILAFVLTLSSQHGRPTLPRVLVEESVAALEGLLAAEREVVYSKAADAASGLVAAMGDGLSGYGGERLVGPLAQLLKCSKLPTSISAATALHGIFAKVKPRTASKDSEDGMWGALEDADALGIIVRTVEGECGNSGKDAAFMQLLAVILERWSESRYRIGCIKSFPATLQLRCMSSSELVSQAALHALSALALCECAASILLQNAGSLWSIICVCVQHSKPYSIRLEALRLLTLLSKTSAFGASFAGPHVEGIAAGCSRALEQARNLGEMRWAPEVETLVVGAAHAASSVLSWPGQHHIAFIQNGIEDSLLVALSGMESKRDDTDPPEQHQPLNSAVDRRSRGTKLNPRLRPLLWEIVGWLGAHSNAQLGNHSSSPTVSEQKVLSKQLPALACVAFSKALRKRGRSPDWYGAVHKFEVDLAQIDAQAKIKEGQPVNSQELVQICKAVLLLISSSSPSIASCTKRCLEDAFVAHGLDWLHSLVTTLTLAGSKTIKIEHVQTMTNLLAVACVSSLDICQEQLLQLKALEVVLEIVKEHVGDVDQKTTEKLSLMSSSVYPLGVKACCVDGQTWEGNDAVLFCALWAYFRLLQCSGWAKKVRETLTLHMLDNLAWDDINDGEIVHLLWTVAGDKQKSVGVRWFGACCLTSFGIYGFPTIVGNDMKRAMNDSSSADLVFMLGDGSRLFAHEVMLIARCKSLLPAKVQSKVHVSSDASDLESSRQNNLKMVHHHSSGGTNQERADSGRSCPVKVQVSPRVTHGSLKALLEFVYTGIVCIPLDLMAEVKILAKRCHLEPLMSLLQGKSPVWGQPLAPYDLSLTLESEGYLVSDILLRAHTSLNELLLKKFRNASNAVADHLHAHRIVLSARCSYFEALFRSGMRDSAQEELKVPARLDTIEKFLLYLYSAELIQEGVSNCAWRNSGTDSQLGFLESLVELAELAGQWVLDDLQQLTVALIGACLDQNIHLCPPILSLAADKQLWAIVDSCATCLAPVYPQLRDSSALDDLREELKDLVRAANVKLMRSG